MDQVLEIRHVVIRGTGCSAVFPGFTCSPGLRIDPALSVFPCRACIRLRVPDRCMQSWSWYGFLSIQPGNSRIFIQVTSCLNRNFLVQQCRRNDQRLLAITREHQRGSANAAEGSFDPRRGLVPCYRFLAFEHRQSGTKYLYVTSECCRVCLSAHFTVAVIYPAGLFRQLELYSSAKTGSAKYSARHDNSSSPGMNHPACLRLTSSCRISGSNFHATSGLADFLQGRSD